ncbi:NYN domain-containing protein [Corynebacterium sp.]|uniref:NYN domain-containing protein n=1 Tax=Corynebacterium sp. TaxID=1720 RepID=UPI0028A7ABEB|nr:NYN domain-containing protein [Corynebacterium sp.]
MLERTVVFVDTSYLLASFYNSWEIGARAQLEIDLPEVVATLRSMIENQIGHPVHRQNWYDGIPDTGPHRYQRALRTCDGVQLRTGQLIEWGERRTQKAVDTRLVADMVVNAMNQHFTDFVLVSGDADMIPGVNEAANNGVRVHLYGFGWDSMSSALRHACDTTTILDPREDFHDAMEIQVLEGPIAPVIPDVADAEEATSTDELPARDECGEPSEVEAAFSSTPYMPEADDNIGDGEPAVSTTPSPTPTPGPTPGPTPTPSPESVPSATPNPDPQVSETPAEPAEPSERVEHVDQAEAANRVKQFDVDEVAVDDTDDTDATDDTGDSDSSGIPKPSAAPKPSMMAPRRKLRSRYVPLPEEVWSSSGFQTPFDVGQQYASWWFENAASADQRDQAHVLSGGGLPPEIDRPLLQFACETLHEYTLTETQRVNLRDGFHSGIRGVLINITRNG